MEFFLKYIAKSFYHEAGEHTGEHCFVFPNRRAGLFFRKYLASLLDKPVWAPAVTTINDLFRSFSSLKPADNELLLIELYKTYRSVNPDAETFDEFYFWGDMLLNDFDDADKYLADASRLFRNVSDLKKIDQQFGGITEEQAEIIKRFWTSFDADKMTDQKKKFIRIWSVLNDLYVKFRKSLAEKGIGYEGMIFRDVIENNLAKKSSASRYAMFHFVGFNALNECEKSLMLGLRGTGSARFYWDYDNSYLKSGQINSAGYFLKENISLFGNDMPEGWSYDTMLSDTSRETKRIVIETSSDVAQVKQLPDLIRKIPGLNPDNAHETAVILADENLLVPVLSSLPESIPDVNITMGYPLRITDVYALVQELTELQHSSRVSDGCAFFPYENVLRILKNGMVTSLNGEACQEIAESVMAHNLLEVHETLFSGKEFLDRIFRKITSPPQFSDYIREVLSLIVPDDSVEEAGDNSGVLPESVRNEFIYRIILAINRIDNVLIETDIQVSTDTWGKILSRLLRMQSVPFSGEPLSGIQIMGILESRALDFSNLIILSVNEGLLPSLTASSSFIPFSLREAFGLPTINHQESVFAYHFYRLLHRASHITFMFNSNSEGLRSGEMSRFLQQMKYDQVLKPAFSSLNFKISNPSGIGTSVDRTDEHNDRLCQKLTGKSKAIRLSPSAINLWLNCRMRFYYRYVCDLKEPETIAGEIDPAMLGTLLHETICALYSDFEGKNVTTGMIENILKQPDRISSLILTIINRKYNRSSGSLIAINENIVRNVLLEYVSRVLRIDSMTAPFRVIALEHEVGFSMEAELNGVKREIRTGGIADRIDEKDGVVRVVDYKTGKVADSVKELADLFVDDRPKDPDGWLQTLVYCEGYLAGNPGVKIKPAVYKVKNVPRDPGDESLYIRADGRNSNILDDYSTVRQEFKTMVELIAANILSGRTPFVMTDDAWGKCSFCPYRVLCRR